MAELELERVEAPGRVTLRLFGALDLASADRLMAEAERMSPGGELTLDLAELTFMDSSGLRAFMNLDRRARRDGWSLSIRNPQGQVLRLLELCGFDQRLPIRNG